MKKGKMQVHAFQVSSSKGRKLEQLLRQIQQKPLKERIRTIGETQFRVEAINNGDDDLWLMDFGRFRDQHGPGKASPTQPVKGFDFGEDETFFEETACLYSPEKEYILIQYNHHGARAGVIESYLNHYFPNQQPEFEFAPKFQKDTDKKFRRSRIKKKLEVGIIPKYIDNEDFEDGTAFSDALKINRSAQSSRVDIVINAGQARGSCLSNYITKTVERAFKILKKDDRGISILKAHVRETLDDKLDVLDLIAQRLVMEHAIAPGSDRRFPRDARYFALKDTYTAWENILT